MLRFFAFLHLPPELSAQHLQQEQHLLFRAILTVTVSSTQQRLLRGGELKKLIAQAAFVETQAHMDLLLCVLTYVAWGYDQFFNKVASSSRLTQLTISLVGALHLHKSLPREAHSMPGEVHEIAMPHTTNAETRQLLLERARAVLCCFLLSSIVSSYFGDMDAMRWTPHGAYLRNIDGTTPCPTDKMVGSDKEPAREFVHEYVNGITALIIIVPTTLVYFLLMLDGSIISMAIPTITSQFDSLLDTGWYGGAYQLASSAFQPLSGKIYTYFSTKVVFSSPVRKLSIVFKGANRAANGPSSPSSSSSN
ncbi:hypothetical protein MPDQ_000581 [Monascus purpureus]|uniref:Uncharacterized protein n=1 Tax=Monascus purpureus TaxID=5098 RepID=A0A507R1V0_MONPU|nr:hypothetical protein MPDQ_000581 [Monascus purpureus]